MTIKIRRLSHYGYKVDMPKRIDVGDWIDIMSADEVKLEKGEYTMVPLGIAVELPKGYEAVVVPRSSTFRRHRVLLANSFGVIDNKYCGNFDEWQFPAICMAEETKIPAGTRIAQFRVQLSQFATPWEKIKWLFTRKINIVEVDVLTNKDRGGIGSTGR